MTQITSASPSFSLKDHLFNPTSVKRIAAEIQQVAPAFAAADFSADVIEALPRLELKARNIWITQMLKKHLPSDYREAVGVLLAALPEPCDPELSDEDYGQFIYAPYSEYVSLYGCNAADLDFSLEALKAMTTRFSAEGPIRVFLNAYPQQTLETLQVWAQDSHYHVRRLVSEGTRPRLPWFQNIKLTPDQSLPLLELLHADKTRYVTRSIANHLNDLSKQDPDLVLTTLARWRQAGLQQTAELDYMTRHALRTLIKQGHAETLSYLGYTPEAPVSVSQPQLLQSEVKIGEALSFSFEIQAQADCRLVVDYLLHFRNAKNGLSAKVFKLKTLELKSGKTATIQKNHPLRLMTTRKLFAGEHFLELQINGKSYGLTSFELIS